MKIKEDVKLKILKERLDCLKKQVKQKTPTVYELIEIEMIEKEICRIQGKDSKLSYLLYRKEQIEKGLNTINAQIISFDSAVPDMFLEFRDELARELKQIEKRIKTF